MTLTACASHSCSLHPVAWSFRDAVWPRKTLLKDQCNRPFQNKNQMSGLEILWLQCKWFLNKNKSYAKHTELSAPQSNTANLLGCLKINCWLNAWRPERSLYSASGSPSAHKTTLKSPMPITFDVCPPNTYITKASEKLWMTLSSCAIFPNW